MPTPGTIPFSAYIDLAVQIEPSLVLVGGVYNFEIGKGDIVSLSGIPAQKPHIGCTVVERAQPYLLWMLRLSQPLDSFESCEVSIEKPARIIYWRMLGSGVYSLPQKAQALAALRNFSENTQKELTVMQEQYNRRFPRTSPLDFFSGLKTEDHIPL